MSQSWVKPPGGNRIYLHCECGETIELARRTETVYSESKSSKYHFDQWLTDHAEHGKGPDHYRLAHHLNPNHDVSPPADPVSNAVRLALVKS